MIKETIKTTLKSVYNTYKKIDLGNKFLDFVEEQLSKRHKVFKPKRNENYFYLQHTNNEWCIFYKFNNETIIDLTNMYIGNCFETKKNADKNKNKIITLLSPLLEV